MDNLINWGIQFIVWLQNLGGWLTPVMKFFTFLGDEKFYLLVAPAILWCVDAALGLRIGLYLMVNGMLNNAVKIVFHGPRPYWYTPEVKVFGVSDNSFGVPSGHAQNGVVVWGTIAHWIMKRSAWLIAIAIVFLIGISRLYLAVHFPHDVLLGWLLGILLLWAFIRLEKPVVNWVKKYTVGAQVLISFVFSLALILLVVLANFTLGSWSLSTLWLNNASLAFPGEPALNPLSFNPYFSNPGAFFGLAAGWIWITSLGGFTTKDVWWKLVLRYLVGIVGVLIFYFGLGSIFPRSETLLAYVLRYFRYALIGFWIAGVAPWVFVKLRLASKLNQKSPGVSPEIKPAGFTT